MTTRVVFIHGLDGDARSSWGPPGQPGAFPDRLATDLPTFTIASYGYPSPLRPNGGQPPPDFEALVSGVLARLESSTARHTAVIAQCLGGMLVRFALPQLLAARQERGQAPGKWSLFLLDVPEDWSDNQMRQPMSDIVTAMNLRESDLRANARWWADRAGPAGLINDHALTSNTASWTSPFKRGSTVPADRLFATGLGHVELAQVPTCGEHPTYTYVLEKLPQ